MIYTGGGHQYRVLRIMWTSLKGLHMWISVKGIKGKKVLRIMWISVKSVWDSLNISTECVGLSGLSVRDRVVIILFFKVPVK